MSEKTLEKYLKELRKSYNYSQDFVASHLNITRQTYSHYETGRITPPLNSLYNLARLYSIPLDTLLEFTINYNINKNNNNNKHNSRSNQNSIQNSDGSQNSNNYDSHNADNSQNGYGYASQNANGSRNSNHYGRYNTDSGQNGNSHSYGSQNIDSSQNSNSYSYGSQNADSGQNRNSYSNNNADSSQNRNSYSYGSQNSNNNVNDSHISLNMEHIPTDTVENILAGDDLDEFLNHISAPENSKKFKYLKRQEMLFLYYYQLLDDRDREDILAFMKVKCYNCKMEQRHMAFVDG